MYRSVCCSERLDEWMLLQWTGGNANCHVIVAVSDWTSGCCFGHTPRVTARRELVAVSDWTSGCCFYSPVGTIRKQVGCSERLDEWMLLHFARSLSALPRRCCSERLDEWMLLRGILAYFAYVVFVAVSDWTSGCCFRDEYDGQAREECVAVSDWTSGCCFLSPRQLID